MRIRIVKGLFGIAILSAMISTCAIDGESNVPEIVCGISLAYIGLTIYANQDIFKGVE